MSSEKYVNITTVCLSYLALNVIVFGGQYVSEKITDKVWPSEKKEIVVKFKERQEIQLPATHGSIDKGKFETLEGKILYFNDANKVTEEKFFSNNFVWYMKKDSIYKIKVIGNENLGYTILGVDSK
ncbi:MAG: hypothetical protein ACP5N2_02605 [Candidatus Nanoarchaeia archaeon]